MMKTYNVEVAYFWDAFIYGVFQGAGNNEMFHTAHDPCFMSFRFNAKTMTETRSH